MHARCAARRDEASRRGGNRRATERAHKRHLVEMVEVKTDARESSGNANTGFDGGCFAE